MNTNKPQALVLLGYSGAGKDTLVKLLQARFGKEVGNCKFGEFNKRLVANMCNVPLSYMEDKHWRTTHNVMRTEFGTPQATLTPFDLLTLLFQAGSSDSLAALTHRTAYQKFTIARAAQFRCPVFTDIRHPTELELVQQTFDASLIYIDCEHLQPSANDTYILEMAFIPECRWLLRKQHDTPMHTLETLLEMDRI